MACDIILLVKNFFLNNIDRCQHEALHGIVQHGGFLGIDRMLFRDGKYRG